MTVQETVLGKGFDMLNIVRPTRRLTTRSETEAAVIPITFLLCVCVCIRDVSAMCVMHHPHHDADTGGIIWRSK